MTRDSCVTCPAVVVHGMEDVRAALRIGSPLTLLSGPGAALYAGCAWWSELMRLARADFPAVPFADALDCADAAGRALEAIRIGQRCLILSPASPGFAAVAAIAQARDLCLLSARPPALDLAERGASRRLEAWLGAANADPTGAPSVDRRPLLG